MSRVQVVRFVVGQQHFALNVMAVKEVVLPKPAQAVPGQPGFVKGLVELRGEYVPLIDLRQRFGAPDTKPDPKILVLTCLKRELALLVDSVGEVQWLESEEMRSARLDTSTGGQSLGGQGVVGPSAVESIADVDGTMVMLLRGEALLSEHEWTQVLPL